MIYSFSSFINLHILILLFSNYNNIIIRRNDNLDKHFRILFTQKDILIKYIKNTLEHVCYEEVLFRVYLNDLLSFIIIDVNYLHLISSLCFSLGHIINYYQLKKYELNNIRMTINQVIYTFILSFFYLQEMTPLISLLCHLYCNLLCIGIHHRLY